MKRCASALAVLLAAPLAAAAQTGEPVHLERDGLKLELAPLGADQVRAFFLARGFLAEDAELIVKTACLFRSAIGSAHTVAASPEVEVPLGDWRVTPAGGSAAPLKVREDWQGVWKERRVAEDAATAFYWALFPTGQTFHATDYNWGFLTFGLAPGTRFDLDVVWKTSGDVQSAKIEGLQCAR